MQEAVRLVFSKFVELGTVRQTLVWFLEHGLQVPVRTAPGEIRWKRPGYDTLDRMLTNPVYGGAYAYGKTEQVPRYAPGGPRPRCRRLDTPAAPSRIRTSHSPDQMT